MAVHRASYSRANTFFVGNCKDIGKVYLHAVIVTCGSCHFTFLNDFKQVAADIAVLHNDKLSIYARLDLPIKANLTDNGRNF